mgnify:CR=1 FL=1
MKDLIIKIIIETGSDSQEIISKLESSDLKDMGLSDLKKVFYRGADIAFDSITYGKLPKGMQFIDASEEDLLRYVRR